MKNIKKFSSFNEAIIAPIDINYHTLSGLVELGLSNTELIAAINQIMNPLNVNFLNYDQFYNSITPEEQATCPPRHARVGPGIQFAYFDTANNQMVIVYDTDRRNSIYSMFDNDRNYEMFIKDLSKIIRHESVHMQQHDRYPRTTLPDVRDPKKYFGNKDEIMAHARTAADEIKHLPRAQIIKLLRDVPPQDDFMMGFPGAKMPMKVGMKVGMKKIAMKMGGGPPPGGMPMGPPPTSLDMYRRTFHMDDAEYKRFKKYLYLYLKHDEVI